jgi:hypothetical protein
VLQCAKPARSRGEYASAVHTIELTDDELRMVRHALTSYLEDFGHEEADILRAIKALLAKIPQPDA